MYGSELAEIYDTICADGVGKDYAEEAAALVEVILARQPATASLLDVACGTGEHLRHLREAFYQVAGVELARPMREIATAARRHGPRRRHAHVLAGHRGVDRYRTGRNRAGGARPPGRGPGQRLTRRRPGAAAVL